MRTRPGGWLLLALLGLGCESEPLPDNSPKLPPETQVGANTMGFRIGDRVIVVKDILVQKDSPDQFSVSGGVGSGWGISVGADSILHPGTYVVDTFALTGSPIPESAASYAENSCIYYTWPPPYVGVLEITKVDFTNRILSGRFSFRANSIPSCGELAITDGRFDVKF